MNIVSTDVAGGIEVKVVLTAQEKKFLMHDLLDVTEWVGGMVAGKLNRCSERMAAEHQKRLVNRGAETVPAKMDALCAAALADPEYKDRPARELQKKQKAEEDLAALQAKVAKANT